MSLKSAVLAIAVLLSAAAGAAQADTIHFGATLTGADEVPPNTTTGKGELIAELESEERVLTYRASASGLTGPAVAAHFHGPAAPGSNAPPVVVVPDPTAISGAVLLTPQQVDDLMAGKWYFNIHTKANPGGEIRGQVKKLN